MRLKNEIIKLNALHTVGQKMMNFLEIFQNFIDFKKNARTSLPGGNQVDGLPPASSPGNGRRRKIDPPESLYIEIWPLEFLIDSFFIEMGVA